LQFFAGIDRFLRDFDRRFRALFIEATATPFSGDFSAPLACGLHTGE
jgi:hypothetical protein